MNKGQVTRVLNAIAKCTENYSLGFRRLHHLPQKVRRALSQKHVQSHGPTGYHQASLDFLAGLSEDDFKTWLAAQ